MQRLFTHKARNTVPTTTYCPTPGRAAAWRPSSRGPGLRGGGRLPGPRALPQRRRLLCAGGRPVPLLVPRPLAGRHLRRAETSVPREGALWEEVRLSAGAPLAGRLQLQL